jgi:hypothetical protein
VIRSAVISDCGTYRYKLVRDLETTGKHVTVVMVNPSTADAEVDDATIRKLLGFAAVNGWGKITVVNKFAFRATDIKALRTAHDPEGPYNSGYVRHAIIQSDIAVVAWGPLSKLPRHLRHYHQIITSAARDYKRQLYCLGVAQDGHPKHPLMLPYSSPLIEWKAP